MTEAERIKGRLRECKNASEVREVADQERANVSAIHKKDPVLAKQIVVLKNWRLQSIEEGRGPRNISQ